MSEGSQVEYTIKAGPASSFGWLLIEKKDNLEVWESPEGERRAHNREQGQLWVQKLNVAGLW